MAEPPGSSRIEGSSRVGGPTRTVGVIGWPVEHSLSPPIHNAAFAALGMDWVYVGLPVEPGHLAEAFRGLAALGFAGANVTMPHKTEGAGLTDTLSDDARRLNAVNTLVIGAEGIGGHNTDVPGFDRFLRHDAGFEPAGRTALLYGAGGAARACALALARAGLSKLTVAAREAARVEGLRRSLNGLGTSLEIVSFADAAGRVADLVINATPVGAAGEELPTPALDPDTLVVDLLYNPSATPLLARAREVGATAFGGLGLLLHQAALSFELWTGRQPSLEVMSAAALARLADRG